MTSLEFETELEQKSLSLTFPLPSIPQKHPIEDQ